MDIVDKFCKYFVTNNGERFLELFSDDAIYFDCLYGAFKGKEEILKFYQRCHREAEGYKFIPKNKIFQGNLFSFEWDFSFILNNNKRVEIEGASFLKILDGNKLYFQGLFYK
jgi:hypothetical protein